MIYSDYNKILRPTDLVLNLTESGLDSDIGDQSWGQIFLTVNLIAKTQEEKEMVFRFLFHLKIITYFYSILVGDQNL